MSVYNEKTEYVAAAVESVLAQTYKDLELIVILDDPENEVMIELLEQYNQQDRRIRFKKNRENIGLAMSLNKAIEMSEGEYLARMDADDISLPERLERELEFLNQYSYDMVSCATEKIDAQGNKRGEIRYSLNDPETISRLLPFQNIIIHPTVLMKRKMVFKAGLYRNFMTCQDYDLWLRFLSSGCKIGILDRPLFQFRRHGNSITATKRFSQFLNEQYIRQLYRERIGHHDQDSFSEADLEAFFISHGYFDKKIYQRENRRLLQYNTGVRKLKQYRLISGTAELLSALRSRYVRENIRLQLSAKKIKRSRINRGRNHGS